MVPGTLSKLVCCNLNITNQLCFQLERKINLLWRWGAVETSPAPMPPPAASCPLHALLFSLLGLLAWWVVDSQCQSARSVCKLHMCRRPPDRAEQSEFICCSPQSSLEQAMLRGLAIKEPRWKGHLGFTEACNVNPIESTSSHFPRGFKHARCVCFCVGPHPPLNCAPKVLPKYFLLL